MGGSGGGFYSTDRDPIDYGQKLRQSENENKDREFEAEVSKLISDLLAKYNDRDVESINQHLDTIKQKLSSEIEGTLDLVFNGSVAKHTYIDGFSDVDALLVLNNTELTVLSPDMVRQHIGDLIKERLPKTDVHIGSQAITVNFHNVTVQILPAIKQASRYKIADDSGKNWAYIKPKEFALKLTSINQKLGGKLVPTIKLAKSIIAQQSERNQISGYHTESLAINIFKNYSGDANTKAMLKHFFTNAKDQVLAPIKDNSGVSIHVDDSLGTSHSLSRKIISNSFDRITKRMNNADGSRDINYWTDILGGSSN